MYVMKFCDNLVFLTNLFQTTFWFQAALKMLCKRIFLPLQYHLSETGYFSTSRLYSKCGSGHSTSNLSQLKEGPSLEHFLSNSVSQNTKLDVPRPSVSYLNSAELKSNGKKGKSKL